MNEIINKNILRRENKRQLSKIQKRERNLGKMLQLWMEIKAQEGKTTQDLYPMTTGLNAPIGSRVTKSGSFKYPLYACIV